MLRLFFLLSLSISCTQAGKRKHMSVKAEYELGLKYMRRGMSTKAVEQFNKVRNYHRDDPHSVKAELAIGDVYFKKREWDLARLAYDDFSRMHPRHPDLDYVSYRIGMGSFKKASARVGRDQTHTQYALSAWDGFSARFPESKHKGEVERRFNICRERLAMKEIWVARFYKRRRAWNAVIRRTDGVLYKYQDSEHMPKALSLFGEASAWEGKVDEANGAVLRLKTDDPGAAEKLAKRVERIGVKLAKRER
jgi:outer membrane protein assembly factor BamD